MSIDEAIEDLKECDSYQVAEWLEELKFLRTTKETMFREIYNQALEDLFNKCNEKYPKNYANEPELGGRSCVFSLNDIKAFKNELGR